MRGEAHVTRIAYGIAELSRREGSALSISSQNARLKGDWIYVRQSCADSQGQLSHCVVMFSRLDYLYLHGESHLLEDVRSDHLCNAEVYLLDDVLYWSGCIWDRRVLPKRCLCGTDFFSECSGDGKQELC